MIGLRLSGERRKRVAGDDGKTFKTMIFMQKAKLRNAGSNDGMSCELSVLQIFKSYLAHFFQSYLAGVNLVLSGASWWRRWLR